LFGEFVVAICLSCVATVKYEPCSDIISEINSNTESRN
jgi:hypothetical protein